MKKPRSYAGLSLDLDDRWTYMKTHSDPGWEAFPSFLDVAVPRILEFLRARDLKITFFVTGKDASFEKNEGILREIVREGHELGNHSLSHEPWFHVYSDSQVEDEIAEAEMQIERIGGKKPMGFRAPGYSLTQRVIEVLSKRGYIYDSSTLPTLITPLARAYYFSTGKFSKEEKEKRNILCGSLYDGLRPLTPYRWDVDKTLLELPITTFPVLRTPVHSSYLYALFLISMEAALFYLSLALSLVRTLGIPPVIILHPPDFLGVDDTSDLQYFPAMNRSWQEKSIFMGRIMDMLQDSFECVPLQTLAEYVLRSRKTAIAPLRSLLR